MIRNQFYLKPTLSATEALARLRARESEHRITVLRTRLAALESASREPIVFTVEDAITTPRH